MRDKKDVLRNVKKYAENNPNIEALLITGSMANPTRNTDFLSDLDVIFISKDPETLTDDKSWRKEFGTILSFFNDDFLLEGIKSYTCLVLYDNYIRIDFSIWSIDLIKKILQKDELPDYLDIGYEVLVDKNNLLDNIKEPTYEAFKMNKPTEKEFLKNVNDFWWDITYIAKYLWRDQFYFAKRMDYFIKFKLLKEMIDWKIGLENNWDVNTGKFGSKYKKYLDTETWKELKDTFSDGNIEKNWKSIFKMINFYSDISKELAGKLSFNYPEKRDEKVTELIEKIYKNEDPFKK